MSPAYGFDDEGQREHDACDVCGSGSCPGSGSGGDDACTYRTRAATPTCHDPAPGRHLESRCDCAPPLSPEEREIVERFAAAGDPYADETPRLGCSLVSHRDLGFCSGCHGYDVGQEMAGWRLLAIRQRGHVKQPWES